MEFVNNLKDPIIFDPKEIRTKENFLRPNQELFANPKPSKVLPENKRNFLITHFLEDESSEKKPLIKEGQHIKQINSRLFSERREQIRSNSNPMLFSFLTDRKRVSLQFPSDYFEMITKDYLPQYRKHKLNSDEFRTCRIKTDSQAMNEYYSQKKFLKKHTFSNPTLKMKNASINTPTAPSTSAQAQLVMNESSLSSIQKMKFELMRNHRPQSSLCFPKEKKTPREDTSNTSIKTGRSKINRPYTMIESVRKVGLASSHKSKPSIEKSKKFNHGSQIEPAIILTTLDNIPGLEFNQSMSRLPTKKLFSLIILG